MATQGREKPERGVKRQGASLRKERRAQPETPAARRRLKEGQFLRSDEWYEEEANIRENGERPKQPD